MSALINRYRYSRRTRPTIEEAKPERAKRRPKLVKVGNDKRVTRTDLMLERKARKEAKERKLRAAYKEMLNELKDGFNTYRRDKERDGDPVFSGKVYFDYAGLSHSGGDVEYRKGAATC
jgi:hypothetical protein